MKALLNDADFNVHQQRNIWQSQCNSISLRAKLHPLNQLKGVFAWCHFIILLNLGQGPGQQSEGPKDTKSHVSRLIYDQSGARLWPLFLSPRHGHTWPKMTKLISRSHTLPRSYILWMLPQLWTLFLAKNIYFSSKIIELLSPVSFSLFLLCASGHFSGLCKAPIQTWDLTRTPCLGDLYNQFTGNRTVT